MTEISKYITIIRPEFMTFCKDACRAAAFNHLLFRIAGKAKDQPRENIQAGKILWYAKTELITSEMSDAWGVCKVRKEVNALVSMGLIGKKSNPTWGVDRTKHFCFGSEQCEAFLKYCEDNHICVVHLDLPNEVKHLIYLSLAFDKTIKCTCEKGEIEQANDTSIGCKSYMYQMHSINISDAFDKSIGTITKTSTKTTNKDNDKEESTYSAPVETAASGTDVPTRAQGEQNGHHFSGSVTGNNICIPGSNPPMLARDTHRTALAQQQTARSEQDSVTAELSTLTVDKPRQDSAKVEPRPSTYQPPARVRSKGKSKTDYRISWSVEGAAFRGWYEEIFGIVLDETAANARACNALGKRASVTYENVKLVQAEISQNKWVKKEHVAVTVQDLAKDDGVMRWERWLQSAQERTRKATPPPAPPVEDNPYSLAAQLARNPLPTLGVTV